MILATLRDLARTLQCRPDQAEDVLRSEPSARAALSRRGLFKAAGAVAAGTLFSQLAPVREIVDFNVMMKRLYPLPALLSVSTDSYLFRAGDYVQVSAGPERLVVSNVDCERGIITVG